MGINLKRLRRDIWQARYLYLLLIPGIIFFVVFHYIPMNGVVLAFKKYNSRLGIWLSPSVGFKNFERIFATPDAKRAIINTLEINFSRLIFQFPIPIMLAILLNEMRGTKLKRVYQTVFTFPHFLSWVVVSSILTNFLASNGAINSVLTGLGMESRSFLAEKPLFRPILYITHNWKEMGWSSIIYMASITAVDQSLYEAATVDGAGRWQQIWHITLPGIAPTIVTLFILQVGRIMNSGFEQIFYLQNAAVKETSDILDTYIYTITFQSTPNYGFSAAVGLFKSVINMLMLLVTNKVVKTVSGSGLFA